MIAGVITAYVVLIIQGYLRLAGHYALLANKITSALTLVSSRAVLPSVLIYYCFFLAASLTLLTHLLTPSYHTLPDVNE